MEEGIKGAGIGSSNGATTDKNKENQIESGRVKAIILAYQQIKQIKERLAKDKSKSSYRKIRALTKFQEVLLAQMKQRQETQNSTPENFEPINLDEQINTIRKEYGIFGRGAITRDLKKIVQVANSFYLDVRKSGDEMSEAEQHYLDALIDQQPVPEEKNSFTKVRKSIERKNPHISERFNFYKINSPQNTGSYNTSTRKIEVLLSNSFLPDTFAADANSKSPKKYGFSGRKLGRGAFKMVKEFSTLKEKNLNDETHVIKVIRYDGSPYWEEKIKQEIGITNLVYPGSEEKNPEFIINSKGDLKAYVKAKRYTGETLKTIIYQKSTEAKRKPTGGELAAPIEDIMKKFQLGKNLAKEIEKMHNLGVVHRDINPDNIMVDGASVRIIDFGLAYSSKYTLNKDQINIGRPFYTPKDNSHGSKVDIYAFGIVLFELFGFNVFVRRPDFKKIFDNQFDEVFSVITDKEKKAEIKTALSKLLLSMTAGTPDKRPDAQSATKQLESILNKIQELNPNDSEYNSAENSSSEEKGKEKEEDTEKTEDSEPDPKINLEAQAKLEEIKDIIDELWPKNNTAEKDNTAEKNYPTHALKLRYLVDDYENFKNLLEMNESARPADKRISDNEKQELLEAKAVFLLYNLEDTLKNVVTKGSVSNFFKGRASETAEAYKSIHENITKWKEDKETDTKTKALAYKLDNYTKKDLYPTR